MLLLQEKVKEHAALTTACQYKFLPAQLNFIPEN